MKQHIVKIALAQLEPENGNTEANMNKALSVIDRAAADDTDILVFPELFYCGYDLPKEELIKAAEPADGKMFQILSRKASEKSIHIAMSYPEKDKCTDDIYISLMMIDDEGRLLHNHRKAYAWTDDLNRVSPGRTFDAFDTKFGKIGMLICYEMEFPEPARILALKGAELVIVSSAFMDTELMEKNLSAIAVHNSMYIAGVNNVSRNYRGRSLFADQQGNIISSASESEEEILTARIDLSNSRRNTYPAYNDYKTMFIDNTLKLYNEASEKILSERK